uniref:Cathepsin L n=1 Tax=Riptortus pedestris TaxID=329032 RepID=R4WCK9_RIPPE|nr:cathepsin L [Riptortus pedestris]
MGMNQFGDLTYEEFSEVILCLNESRLQKDIPTYTYIPPATLEKVPEEVDWRQQGAVTPVKNQAACGSCWAFSATGALEGQHFRKTGQLVKLSEQQLVDCGGEYGNLGCQGGWPYRGYYYMINKGIATTQDYPYNGQENTCRAAPSSGVVANGLITVAEDEGMLKIAVATVGPISICIDVTNIFKFYKSGIFIDDSCSSIYTNHAVLAVGYGSENGQDYWLVKNSWGTSWGEQGYIRMARNRRNQCAVTRDATYPLT